MTAEEFTQLFERENEASRIMLIAKAKEYAGPTDRLQNFKQAAGARNTNPADALIGMVVKQFVSLSEMSKDPLKYSNEQWDEKLRDVRNYTYLLRGVVTDLQETISEKR